MVVRRGGKWVVSGVEWWEFGSFADERWDGRMGMWWREVGEKEREIYKFYINLNTHANRKSLQTSQLELISDRHGFEFSAL